MLTTSGAVASKVQTSPDRVVRVRALAKNIGSSSQLGMQCWGNTHPGVAEIFLVTEFTRDQDKPRSPGGLPYGTDGDARRKF